jgi:hypothetical protein
MSPVLSSESLKVTVEAMGADYGQVHDDDIKVGTGTDVARPNQLARSRMILLCAYQLVDYVILNVIRAPVSRRGRDHGDGEKAERRSTNNVTCSFLGIHVLYRTLQCYFFYFLTSATVLYKCLNSRSAQHWCLPAHHTCNS